jgi:hypothetical protein
MTLLEWATCVIYNAALLFSHPDFVLHIKGELLQFGSFLFPNLHLGFLVHNSSLRCWAVGIKWHRINVGEWIICFPTILPNGRRWGLLHVAENIVSPVPVKIPAHPFDRALDSVVVWKLKFHFKIIDVKRNEESFFVVTMQGNFFCTRTLLEAKASSACIGGTGGAHFFIPRTSDISASI